MYPDISLDGSDIRVIRIKPGSWNSKIQCGLFTHSFILSGDWDAVSYVWGSIANMETIELEGIDFQVTASLALLLRQLRRTALDRDLWIDQLCIKQSDIAEKNSQVRKMQQIYAGAAHVYTYFGDDPSYPLGGQVNSHEIPAACSFTCMQQSFPPSFSYKDSIANTPRGDGSFLALNFICQLACQASSAISRMAKPNCSKQAHLLNCLKAFVDSIWWTRIWISQEIILAKDPIIMFGSVSAPWNMLTTAMALWRGLVTTDRQNLVPALSTEWKDVLNKLGDVVESLEDGKEQYKGHVNTQNNMTLAPFLRVLRKFRVRQATDARDKIYGLRGLIHPDLAELVKIEYTIPPAELYLRTTLNMIQNMNSLWPIVDSRMIKSSRHDLPSWVPDWSDCHEASQDISKIYFATGRLNPSFENVNLETCTSSGKLEVQGLKFDDISDLSCIMNDNDTEFWETIRQWRLDMPSKYSLNDFWRVICGDIVYFRSLKGLLDPLQHSKTFSRRYVDEDFLFFLYWFYRNVPGFDDAHENKFLWEFFYYMATTEDRSEYVEMIRNSLKFELDQKWYDFVNRGPDNILPDAVYKLTIDDLREGMSIFTHHYPILMMLREYPDGWDEITHTRSRFWGDCCGNNRLIEHMTEHEMNLIKMAIRHATIHRRLFVTKHGFVGLGHQSMKDGDYIAFVTGINVPLILRTYCTHCKTVAITPEDDRREDEFKSAAAKDQAGMDGCEGNLVHEFVTELVGDCFLLNVMDREIFNIDFYTNPIPEVYRPVNLENLVKESGFNAGDLFYPITLT